MTEPVVVDAECCEFCANTAPDFTFKDGVLCHKNNEYRYDVDTCQLFERKNKE